MAKQIANRAAGPWSAARCSAHIIAAHPHRRTSSLRRSASCVGSAAPAGRRRRRNPSHRSGAGECNRHCDNNEKPDCKIRSRASYRNYPVETASPAVESRPGVRRHLLTLPRSAAKTYLRQASWLMATSDVPPPSHPIRAVAEQSASLRTLTGGRLTNYSGGTAPDSHRISFSARLPRFHDFPKNRGSRATGRHFVSVSVVNGQSVSGHLILVNPLHRQ